jgi:hypothetical protein
MKVRLQHVAHARSGDKGDTSNIAVFAYAPELYPLLIDQLTVARFKDFYAGAIKGEVMRYPVPGLHAINFVCHGALGGGHAVERHRVEQRRVQRQQDGDLGWHRHR